jgi:hypothetical protein
VLQFRAEAGLLGRRMSKLQPSPEVLLSIDARRGPGGRARLLAGVLAEFFGPTGRAAALAIATAMTMTGCLSPESNDPTTDVALSETGVDAGTTGSESTHAPVMTTTEEPETTAAASSSSSGGDSDSTTTETPVGCGDGSLQAPEECDYGSDNADDGECTTACKKAVCGDGKVNKSRGGLEVCDDGVNDNTYGGCGTDCMSLAPHCGDGEINGNEACDEADPKDGCLIETCQFAQSCRQIRDSFINEELVDGVYTIKPADKDPVQVLCDMDADGGGYTFLKIALPDGQEANATEAEAKCAQYGMSLLVPRSPEHVVASTLAAKSILLDPLGGGTTKGSMDYMSILGVYPVKAGQSCVGKAVNSVDCPEWQANDGAYWVTAVEFPGQPATNNCEDCSMAYYWSDAGVLTGIEAINGGGIGFESQTFLCDTGDKQGVM